MRAAALVLLGLLAFGLLLALCSSCSPAALLLQREALGYLRRAQEAETHSTGAALSTCRACAAAARAAEAAAWLSYPDVSQEAAAARLHMRESCSGLPLNQTQDLGQQLDQAQDQGGLHVG